MNKEEIIKKLAEVGIESRNAYPKTSFIYDNEPSIALYEREMKDDFYFFNKFDKKLYKWKRDTEKYEYDPDTEKFMIPLYKCQVVWEDKPFVEKADLSFKDMSLRHYACIHLRVPDSGLDWLDNLIKLTAPL